MRSSLSVYFILIQHLRKTWKKVNKLISKRPNHSHTCSLYLTEHHVKFKEGQENFENHNLITIQKLSPSRLQAHLGFLKLNHTYEVVITLDMPGHIDHKQWIIDVSHNNVPIIMFMTSLSNLFVSLF